MKENILFIVLILSLPSFGLDLDQLKLEGEKNNFALRAAKFHSLEHRAYEKDAISHFYPRFGIEASLSKDSNGDEKETEATAAIYGEYNLFNGFKDHNELKKSRLATQRSKSELREEEFNLRLRIERYYYRFLYLSEQQRISQETLSRNKDHIGLIKRRLSSGLVTKTDLLEFELQGSQLEAKLEFLKLKKDEVSANLKRIVGLEDNVYTSPKGELPHLVVEGQLSDLLIQLEQNNEAMKRAKLRVQELDLDVVSAKANWFPKIDLEAKYGYLSEDETDFTQSDPAYSVAILAKWEFFSGNSTKYQKEAKEHARDRRHLSFKQKMQDAISSFEGNYRRLLAIQGRIELEEKNEKIAENLYQRTYKEYQRGVKDSGALSSAGLELAHVRERIFDFKMQFIEAKLDMEEILGKRINVRQITH